MLVILAVISVVIVTTFDACCGFDKSNRGNTNHKGNSVTHVPTHTVTFVTFVTFGHAPATRVGFVCYVVTFATCVNPAIKG